jgi:hypothetical protein
MSYTPALSGYFAEHALTLADDRPDALQRMDSRVRHAVAATQAVVLIRALATLVVIGFLPAYLPFISIDVSTGTHMALPLSGAARDAVLLGAAALAAFELLLAFHLKGRRQFARVGVIAVECILAAMCGTAFILGADLAVLPLVLSAVAVSLLMLNQVRWSFRLRPSQRLTGRRSNVYAGYAPGAPDAPKERQAVGYLRTLPPRD